MKNPSRRNRILTYYKEDRDRLSTSICYVDRPVSVNDICGKVICGDTFAVAEQLPKRFVDLLILDPPYNLDSVRVRLATFTEASTWSCLPLRHSRSVLSRNPGGSVPGACSEWDDLVTLTVGNRGRILEANTSSQRMSLPLLRLGAVKMRTITRRDTGIS